MQSGKSFGSKGLIILLLPLYLKCGAIACPVKSFWGHMEPFFPTPMNILVKGPKQCWNFFFCSLFWFTFWGEGWAYPQHTEVLGPKIKPVPWQWSLSQQWQHWILSLFGYKGTLNRALSLNILPVCKMQERHEKPGAPSLWPLLS